MVNRGAAARVPVPVDVFRVARAAVFAVACVLLSLGMHVLAGGAQVRPEVLTAAAAVTGAGALALTGRQRGPETLLPACFAAQYGMHHAFAAGSVHGLHLEVLAGHDPGLWRPFGMVLAHGVVAAVSGWWLARGEAALGMLLHLLAGWVPRLRHLLAGPAPVRRAARPATAPPVAVPRPRPSVPAPSGRGPPRRTRA
ncbi:hypothetical protein [Thermocatellispora tengchongensis]|uniref:hypothetical protein n=1 Tax=Thermocatellispora tengchongensis TaxID=1073253 RepID=UPI003630F9BD